MQNGDNNSPTKNCGQWYNVNMALPINIKELLSGNTVEWERLEFKEGWNPLEVMQTICAFANDINNWGGGYIVIGVKDENGVPVLPPTGLRINQIDKIQKELIGLCNKILPNYYPITEVTEINESTVLIIWAPAGDVRPYKAPTSLEKNVPKDYKYFVRHGSTTKRADAREEKDLIITSAHTPYDDRVRQENEITDLKLPLIQNHLAEIGSALLPQSSSMPFDELCRRMNIAAGPDEFFKPKNIGLLLFNDDPTKFFPCARIDLVRYRDDVGDDFKEKTFSGPIQHQLQDVLVHIKNTVIAERVRKIPGEASASRVFNYPFEAIEEALANTVYHRSYEDDSPIEIREWPDRIEIVSYPGPLPPLNKEKLRAGKIVARKYRNRRVGDFLKELHLTEGKGTGILKIKRAMQLNGSPEPMFDTDDELSYFLVELPIHPDWHEVQDEVQVGAQVNRGDDGYEVQVGAQVNRGKGVYRRAQVEYQILRYCKRPKKRREVLASLDLYNNQSNFNRFMKPLIIEGYLAPTVPDKPNSKNQQYKTTASGQARLLSLERVQ